MIEFLFNILGHSGPPKMDHFKAEAVFRLILATLACYILAIASLPEIVPPSQRTIVAIAGSILPLLLPKLLFGIAAAFPPIIGMITIASLGGTLLLAAATVSNAVFTIVFALYTLAFTTLYFGSAFDKTSGFVSAYISLAALMALSLYPLVQNGFSVSTSPDSKVPEAMQATVWEHFCSAVEPNDPDCIDNRDSYNWSSGPIGLPGNASDAFAGQSAYLSIENGQVTLDIPGGLWLVKAFWTESGLDNYLAVFKNLYIALGWMLACHLVLAILLPFPRPMRRMITRVVVPASIQRVHSLIEEKRNRDEQHGKEEEEKMVATKRGIIHHWTTYSRKIKAIMITFEPRWIRAPLEYIVPDLQNVLDEVRKTLVAVLNYATYGSTGPATEEENQNLDRSMELLQAASQALKTCQESDAQALKTKLDEFATHSANALTHGGHLQRRCQLLAQASSSWIHLLNDPPKTPAKDAPQHILKTYLPWILSPLFPLIRLVTAFVVIPINHKQWSIRTVLWSCKLAAGYVVLFCMTVYWPAFANFRLEITGDELGGVYHGWHLLGYAYATMPTVEGTVKKGISRIFGTCVGCFWAWLGVIVCSGSTDNDAEINPYGLIVWLTFFTAFVSLFYVDTGYGAFLGISPDDGYKGMYTIMTMVLIAFEVYTGAGNKNDLTLNRLVATLTGVAMAIVVAGMPPQISGGDPIHARRYKDSMDEAIQELSRLVEAKDKDSLTGFRKNYLAKTTLFGRRAFHVHDDAARLHRLPLCRVDKRLQPVLESLALTETLLDQTATELLNDVEGANKPVNKLRSVDVKGVEVDVLSNLMARGKASLQNIEQAIAEMESERGIFSAFLLNQTEPKTLDAGTLSHSLIATEVQI